METFCKTNLSAFLRLLATWLDRHLLKNTYLQRSGLTMVDHQQQFAGIQSWTVANSETYVEKHGKTRGVNVNNVTWVCCALLVECARLPRFVLPRGMYQVMPLCQRVGIPENQFIHSCKMLKDTSSGNSPMNGNGALALVSVQCCGQANLESNPLSSLHLLKPGTSQSLPQVIPIQWLYCDCIVFAFLCFLHLFHPVSPPFSMFILPDLPGPASFSESFRNLSISRWTTASSCKLG